MKVVVSTTLPVSADEAWALARRPATVQHVVKPILRITAADGQTVPEQLEPGMRLNLRISPFGLGLLPSWSHQIDVVAVEPYLMRTEERGGSIRTWRHTLSFTPLGNRSCLYEDRIELDAGPLTPLVWLYTQGFYRYRHARWRRLARTS
jgi:ligand-binding SRPBCC domain-containing protein